MRVLGGVTFMAALLASSGVVTRKITLSGRRNYYIMPMGLRGELLTEHAAMALGLAVTLAGSVGLIVGLISSSQMAAWIIAGVSAPGASWLSTMRMMMRVNRDVNIAAPRRRARFPNDPTAW